MHFARLRSTADPMFAQAMALYAASFPVHEQREAASQAAILRLEEYHFDLIFDGETFAGLLLYWDTPEFQYVEHFCVEPTLRNQRYGQRALELLGSAGKAVILEIDPPVDGTSLRRRNFYLRCGYQANPFSHIHPPYHKGSQGHPLVVMSQPQTLDQAQYDRFNTYLRETVMGIRP